MKIKIIKFNNFTKPFRAHHNDAGADVYSPQTVVIGPHETIKIPLGFGIELPDGFMGVIFPRSSYAAKGIVAEHPPIDSGYRGEIHAIITNMTKHNVMINEGDRIGQLIIIPIIVCDFVESIDDERGELGFGSTGK